MPKERVAIGMVADAVTWWHAATLVQQLKNLQTKLQIVVFYLGTIDGPVATTFSALGARVKEISMPVPFPESSKFWNNKRDNLLRIAEGDVVARWYAPYAKLAAWNQTEWHKVVLLDTDVVIAQNIDEMAQLAQGLDLNHVVKVYDGAKHFESDWGRRMPEALMWVESAWTRD